MTNFPTDLRYSFDPLRVGPGFDQLAGVRHVFGD